MYLAKSFKNLLINSGRLVSLIITILIKTIVLISLYFLEVDLATRNYIFQ